MFFQVLGSGANQHLTIQWNQISFFSGGTAGDGITFEALLYADGRVQFNYLDLVSGAAAGNNGASATAGIKAAGTQGLNRLLLAFNNGPNVFIGTGKSTVLSQPVGVDWYTTTLAAGQTALNLTTSTPGDGPGEFVNVLNPRIELYDVTGTTLLFSGVVGGDGRNESITASGLTPGATYKIRVLSEGSTAGEYFLGVNSLRNVIPTVLVDNTSFSFTTRGAWSIVSGGYGGNYRQIAGNGDGSLYAQWQYGTSFTAGTSYEFFVTWVAAPTNATNARYKIFDGASQIGTVFLNQTLTPNSATANSALWQSLFVFTPATTGFHVIRVQVDNSGNGNVIADALFDPPLDGGQSPVVTNGSDLIVTISPLPQLIEPGATLGQSVPGLLTTPLHGTPLGQVSEALFAIVRTGEELSNTVAITPNRTGRVLRPYQQSWLTTDTDVNFEVDDLSFLGGISVG